MSKKYREAALAKQHFRTELRLQDRDIDGATEGDAADTLQAYDEYEPAYEGDVPDGHLDEQILPF